MKMTENLQVEGLVTYYTRVSDITHLYSETESDPIIMAKCDAPELAAEHGRQLRLPQLPYEIEVIPRPVNKVETRILIFVDKDAHLKYLMGL